MGVIFVLILLLIPRNNIDINANLWAVLISLLLCNLSIYLTKAIECKNKGRVHWQILCVIILYAIAYYFSCFWSFIFAFCNLYYFICNKKHWSLSLCSVLMLFCAPLIFLIFKPETDYLTAFLKLTPIGEDAFRLHIKDRYFSHVLFEFFAFAFVSIGSIIFICLINYNKFNKLLSNVIICLILCATILTLFINLANKEKKENIVGNVKILANENNWEEVLQQCNYYWQNAADKQVNVGSTNFDIANYTKLALLKTGTINEYLFNYINYPFMLPLFTEDNKDMEFMSTLYIELGLYEAAYHNATNCLYSSLFNSATVLKNLCIASINTNNLNSVRVPLSYLKKSPRHSSWVDSIERVINKRLISNVRSINIDSVTKLNNNHNLNKNYIDSVLGRGSYKNRGEKLFFITKMGDFNINNSAYLDTNSRLLFDYIVALALLRKDVGLIYENIYEFKRMGYKHLPIHVEEALLMFFDYGEGELNTNNIKSFRPAGFSFREETINRCDYFLLKFRLLNEGKFSEYDMTNEFGNTYWYYYLFGDPTWAVV